jgi:hypothetical protein
VKILPCAPQCGCHSAARITAFQAENEGASPSYRTKNLEPSKSRDSIAFVVQWFTTPACHAGDEGSIPSDCTKVRAMNEQLKTSTLLIAMQYR